LAQRVDRSSVNPQDLRKCIATLVVMAYVLADIPEPLVKFSAN
jgi:hypothetical protein